MHAVLHTLAVICVVLALIAAFTSHTLKRPVPTPNLYSPHSYLGVITVILLGAQVCSSIAFSILKCSGCVAAWSAPTCV